jgi:hypothetical protein
MTALKMAMRFWRLRPSIFREPAGIFDAAGGAPQSSDALWAGFFRLGDPEHDDGHRDLLAHLLIPIADHAPDYSRQRVIPTRWGGLRMMGMRAVEHVEIIRVIIMEREPVLP